MRWILAESLVPIPEPLGIALRPGGEATPQAVAALAARALLDRRALESRAWPAWLAPHQVPAAERVSALVERYRGALLADAVGLGKSFVALAVALARAEPFALVVPAVLVPQWRGLLERFDATAPIITHESLSVATDRPSARPAVRLYVVDEAHRFRNPNTNRYGALARLAAGARVLLVTATPVHNRLDDLVHLLRLFLRDHALAALGVPSLRRAARGDLVTSACARFVVARSRARVRGGYAGGPVALSFPQRTATDVVRAGCAPDPVLAALVAGVRRLTTGGAAAPLLRLVLLRRLASSLPAFRASLRRHRAYVELARGAAAEGRRLGPRDFQRCFPPGDAPDLQLVLFPLLLETGRSASPGNERDIARLDALAADGRDPKADALERLLAARPGKTIVFTDARPTVRHLLQRLRRRRAAALFGMGGRFGSAAAAREEVLRAFAPLAQGAPPPPAALETDLLIATDLVSEGLNLQDAGCVVHYDLPWSPARLAQRVGRIDRLGSPHPSVSSVTFLPPEPLVEAIAIEERLATKLGAQVAAGAAQVEPTEGRPADGAALDWCDQLDELARRADAAPAGAWAAVRGTEAAVVLAVRIGMHVEAIVVDAKGARADPSAATRHLTDACRAEPTPVDRRAIERAVIEAAPLVRARVAALQGARWRAADRDRLARRLIPWVLAAGRRAARRGDAAELAALDALVSRLALGMSSGEELLLEDLLGQREPLAVRDLLRWHETLSPVETDDSGLTVELVAALVVQPAHDAR